MGLCPNDFRYFKSPSPREWAKTKKPFPLIGERALIVVIAYCLTQIFFDYLFNLSFRLNTYQLLHNLPIFDE